MVEPVVTDPAVVRALAKTSPSASTKNLTLLPTRRPRRLVSLAADEGLMTKDEVVAEAPPSLTAQAEKVWAVVGMLFTVRDVELALKTPPTSRVPDIKALPPTEKVVPGVEVPMPTL